MDVFKSVETRKIKPLKNEYTFSPSVIGTHEELLSMFVGEFPDKTWHVSSAGYGDFDHYYSSEVNNLGYRSPDFGKADLITLGCSQTFGLGVCFENIWPVALSKTLGNMSYANLAFPGWSVTRMVDSFYKYIEEHGKPKAVAIHMPDFHRVLTPLGRDTVDTRPQNSQMPKVTLTDGTFYSSEIYVGRAVNVELPKISKRPYKLGEVLIPEISYHQNFMALNNFLIFCKYSGIAVAVSSWSPEISELISAMDYISDDVYFNFFEGEDLETCKKHDYIKANLIHDEFNNGTDLDTKTGFSHMGAHEHLHIAEGMAERLLKQL